MFSLTLKLALALVFAIAHPPARKKTVDTHTAVCNSQLVALCRFNTDQHSRPAPPTQKKKLLLALALALALTHLRRAHRIQ